MLTHVGFVLEGVGAPWTETVEVGGAMGGVGEWTVGVSALFGCFESLESFPGDVGRFPMGVCVHLHVRSAYINLVTTRLQAMIVGLTHVVDAAGEGERAIVRGGVTHESMRQGLFPLPVPFVMSEHLFLLGEQSPVALLAMEVLPTARQPTLIETALNAVESTIHSLCLSLSRYL